MRMKRGLQSAHQRVECFAGIGLAWPQGLTNGIFREAMCGSAEEKCHQLLLHGSEVEAIACGGAETILVLVE